MSSRRSRPRGGPTRSRSAGGWSGCCGPRNRTDPGSAGGGPTTCTAPALAGRGESTASQTAWALLALLAAGEHHGAATERGIRWLAQTQRADGSWDQPQYTGTGFPGDVYINYHLYRLAFPINALGRYVDLTHPEVAHAGDDPAS